MPRSVPELDTVYHYRVKPRFIATTIHRLFRPATVVPGLSCALVIIQNLVCGGVLSAADGPGGEPGLVGYWTLRGDCQDHSGQGHHGVNHGVDLEHGQFDGIAAHIEVPSAVSFKFGIGDFTLAAWIHTAAELDDVLGDVLDLYDPSVRKGITLAAYSSGGGYQGQGSDRHIAFGIDNSREPTWENCGAPSETSPYISNSMVTYRGKLYVAITDAKEKKDWCHVFCYEGGRNWTDCGRVGASQTTGVGPLVVHQGALYAVTWTYDWTRIRSGRYDAGRVYQYAGGTNWVDCGQPSDDRTLNSAASYKGRLYVGGGPETWGVFVRTAEGQWTASKVFPKQGARRLFPHAMSRYNGRLFTGYPCVYAFDGNEWTYAGLPGPLDTVPSLQTHSFTVYQGKLCAGTWPEAKVSRYLGGEDWEQFGRVGEDGTEVNALAVYNGKLYGGSIPRAELCRYDGRPQWTSLKRFYSPPGWQPAPPRKATPKEVAEWSRVTSLAIHQGKLFAGIGSCTSALVDKPADPAGVLGRVFSLEAGKCVSYDEDLGPGWKHLAAVREQGRLKLYVNGELVAQSAAFNRADFDVSTDRPLRIGVGQTDYFSGNISEVRIYNQALSPARIRKLSQLSSVQLPRTE
ncbi:MAG TPA: LamG domain-containing protein [Verrucomicrobiae bacterium]|nr:LamG domain-containing protein [Verrucomicrobiae bacterium]